MPPVGPRTALAPGERVCIVGAGCSGIATAKALAERGVPFDCYEQGSALGGLWPYENDNGRSGAYESLHLDSSTRNTQFSDFPMPENYADFPQHADVLRYLEAYAEHFGVTPHVRFRTDVVRVVPTRDAARNSSAIAWDVTLRDRDGAHETRRFGAVAVCTGHHWNPRVPDYPGHFDGETLHSHDYRRPDAYAKRRVLVVGIGNSAVDIAVDLVGVAGRVTLSTRSSAWIVPKYLLGRPADRWITRASERVPRWIRACAYRVLVYLAAGDQTRHGILAAHPTLTQDLLTHVAHGRVAVRPNVAELDGSEVVFEDGTREPFDAIVYATGYRVTFPFLAPDVVAVDENRVALYQHVVEPRVPGLYFVGLVQPAGSVVPIAERQGRWVAGLVAGDWILPDVDTMRRSIAAEARAVAARHRASARHAMQVDFWTYAGQIEREMRDGARRIGARRAVA